LEKTHGYLPTKLEFLPMTLEDPGSYHLSTQFKGITDNIASLESAVVAVSDMERMIKKNFKLSEEKVDKFKETNPV